MVRLARSSLLLAFASSAFVNGYVIDSTCDCYDFVEESMSSAFSMAENAYKMLDNAQKNTGDQSQNAAVRALSQAMFGKEDAAWTVKSSKGNTPKDVYQFIYVLLQNKKVSYENVDATPPITMVDNNGTPRPEKGWTKNADKWEFVVYCDVKNWSAAPDKKKVYDWALDAVLSSDISTDLQTVMNRCMGGFTMGGREMAFTYKRGDPNDLTVPAQVSQMVLCPWFLKEKHQKEQTTVSQLKKIFDQFKGDPATKAKKITGFFKEKFADEVPEIERYLPLDQVILHELSHMPQYGNAEDVGKKCYGWRNCAKLSKDPKGITNADSLAYFALALWFVSQDVCVTANGNLVPSEAALKNCGAAQPGLSDSTKKSDDAWAKQAAQPGEGGMDVTAVPSSSKGDNVFLRSPEFKRDGEA